MRSTTTLEMFFGSFYRLAERRMAAGRWIPHGVEKPCARSGIILGSGLVLWSARPLLDATARQVATTARRPPSPPPLVLLPAPGARGRCAEIIAPTIKAVKENQLLAPAQPVSSVHPDFTLVNASADYKGTASRPSPTWTCWSRSPRAPSPPLSAAAEAGDDKRRSQGDDSRPLTSDLMRSVHEHQHQLARGGVVGQR
jgi:hypothetical protein